MKTPTKNESLSAEELIFLYYRVMERERQAREDGITTDDPSSVFRRTLAEKLIRAYWERLDE